MFDVITIGGATRDITFLTDKGKVIETPEELACQRLLGFEYGAKIRSEDVRTNFGGGACNAAATFANMGLRAAACVRVGADENGKSIKDNLAARGIDTGLVQTDGEHATGFAFVVINEGGEGERMIFVHKGAGSYLSIPKDEIKDTKWIYLSALAGDWERGIGDIAASVEESGAGLVWNPGATEIAAGKEKLQGLLARTSIFIVNKDEAIELVQSDKNTTLSREELNDVEKLIGVVKGWGAKMVVITDGRAGAYFFTGSELLKAPALIEEQVDMTGAGDAFGSGLLAGYILTDDAEAALKYGILNGSGTVRDYGAQNGLISREEAEAKLGEVMVERIK